MELLAKMGYVAGDPALLWCARLALAVQVLSLLESLSRSSVMHCDFKPDQLGVARRDKSYSVLTDSYETILSNNYTHIHQTREY